MGTMKGIAGIREQIRETSGKPLRSAASLDRTGQPMAIRMTFRMKSQLTRLAALGDRPVSWLVVQALNRLLRELEVGILLPDDLHRQKQHLDRGDNILHVTLPPARYEALGRLTESTGKDFGTLTRMAVGRYLAVRLALLRAETAYQDSLVEPLPELPP